MSVDDEALKPLRERIDSIDRQLLTLINARAQCALEVGEIKQGQPMSEAPIFCRPEREAQILTRLMAEKSWAIDRRRRGRFVPRNYFLLFES